MKNEFYVWSIRQLTADKNHNGFTGAAWFQGALYVAYRQGDSHACKQGRLVVMRSRDEGARFDIVAVFRGEFDTRDAHLYTDGDRRMFVTGLECGGSGLTTPGHMFSGTAWTDDGLHWTAWTRCTGADGYAMWRPQTHGGQFYCAGYTEHGQVGMGGTTEVSWFQSRDGLCWEKQISLHAGDDIPGECSFDFKADGSVVMLMRRDGPDVGAKPLLLRSAPPYQDWQKVELDLRLGGPALWLVGDDIWFSGRWYLTPFVTHVGVFKVVEDKPVLQMVLPSGPWNDVSYMGVARHPLNRHRFALAYYSVHTANEDPKVSQIYHPDIYLADITFTADYLTDWQVSDVLEGATLQTATADEAAGWRTLTGFDDESYAPGFVDAQDVIAKRKGVIFFRTSFDVGTTDAGVLHLGFDGPIEARLNGEVVGKGTGGNPALPDRLSVPVTFRRGANELEIALDTNGGGAVEAVGPPVGWPCGIFARWEDAE